MMVARRRSVPGVHDSLGRESITKCRVYGFAMDFRGYISFRRRSVPGVHDSLERESITKCRVRGFAMDFRG